VLLNVAAMIYRRRAFVGVLIAAGLVLGVVGAVGRPSAGDDHDHRRAHIPDRKRR
jgi:hypothetical protein